MNDLNRIMDFFSRTNNAYTRAGISRIFPDIDINAIGADLYRLWERGKLQRRPVKDLSRRRWEYYCDKPVVKKSYKFIKPAESLI